MISVSVGTVEVLVITRPGYANLFAVTSNWHPLAQDIGRLDGATRLEDDACDGTTVWTTVVVVGTT